MNNLKKVLIASDHAGYEFKLRLKSLLKDTPWEDLGPDSAKSVDYPDFAKKLAYRIQSDETSLGILICGSGIGMSIAANRVRGVRAALISDPVSARLAREHNDANVLCLAARFLAPEYAAEITQIFLKTLPSQDERHLNRIKKIDAP